MTDTTGPRKALGVPYARQDVRNGRVYQTCPRCGQRFEMTIRKDFESFAGGGYADHYVAEHAVTDGYVVIDGELYEPAGGPKPGVTGATVETIRPGTPEWAESEKALETQRRAEYGGEDAHLEAAYEDRFVSDMDFE